MAAEPDLWLPGSFTKNYSWGPKEDGLRQLHEAINVGFEGVLESVPRELFRSRNAKLGRPELIPINYFLFNRIENGVNVLVPDELVFQALNFPHSKRFDKLALFSLLLSRVGVWSNTRRGQRYPALWAQHFVLDKVAGGGGWRTSDVNADAIEWYLQHDPRYRAEGARKVATNLNWVFQNGRLSEFGSGKVERWWVDALFLSLDRLIDDAALSGTPILEGSLQQHLAQAKFGAMSGAPSLEKDLATKHLVSLYSICGGRERFDDNKVRTLTELRIPDYLWVITNDQRPIGAVHPTNPSILKSIPRSCAMLARYLGFEEIPFDELETFDPAEFVRHHTVEALKRLNERGVNPKMSADELRKLTRGE